MSIEASGQAGPRDGTVPLMPQTALDTSANRLRLSIVDVTFALFCLIPPLVFGAQLLNSDGDAARHIRMGELMLRGGLYQNDPFSFTRPDEPILLTEWASRIAYALAHSWAGLTGVALLAGLLIGTSTALLVLFLRRRGVDPLLSYLVGIAAAVISQLHWLARPHLFSLVAFALLLFLLEPGERRRTWWFAALFIPWANLHGAYVLGFILIAVCLAGALAEARLSPDRREHWLSLARWYGTGLLVAIAASVLNPQGPLLLWHVVELLGNTTLTSGTHEFMSPDFHQPYAKIFLVFVGLIITAFAVIGTRPTLPRLGIILLMFAGACVARRNIALFGIIALPTAALHVDSAWRSLQPGVLKRVRTVFQEGERIAAPGRWVPIFLIPILALGAMRGSVMNVQMVPNRFDPEVFPVEAVEYAKSAGLEGRLFSFFTWGGYVVYAWPGQKIFIDGMTDYFGDELLLDYGKINRLGAGWAERIEHWGITLVLVHPESQLDYQLRREPGWTVRYEDETAVLLQRAVSTTPYSTGTQ